MHSYRPPDYAGASLVNLVAEVEHRLTGTSESTRLHPHLRKLVPNGSTYVLLLIDGLGSRQLTHPAAASLGAAKVSDVDAPFPTTTTVSWATIATGLPASRHGLLGYQLYLPETGGVVHTIKWTRPWGEAVDLGHRKFLPAPNLWERLTAAGIEPITVQPGNFSGSHLSNVLFRGCRFEAVYTEDELVAATTQLAATPDRMIVTYVPHIDVAAHVYGQKSDEYTEAVAFVDRIWQRLSSAMPATAVLIGTADHGHIDFPETAFAKIDRRHESSHIFYGDSRITFVKGRGEHLAAELPAEWLPLEAIADWWGPGPKHPHFAERAPDGILVADDDHILLHRYTDERLIGRHGGLTDAERLIPLLVAGRSARDGLSEE